MSGIHDFTAKSLAGEDVPLKRFEGQHHAAFLFWDSPAISSEVRNPVTPVKSSNSAPSIMALPFRCSPRSTSTAATPIRCINI
jgi:hypothetical protein